MNKQENKRWKSWKAVKNSNLIIKMYAEEIFRQKVIFRTADQKIDLFTLLRNMQTYKTH